MNFNKTLVSLALAACLFAAPALSISCYQCAYSEATDLGDGADKGCADNGDDIGDEFLSECDGAFDGADVCVFIFHVDNDDKESYVRTCGFSENYNDEEDKCESYGAWGVDVHECVCDEDDCNGSDVAKMSAMAFVASVALRQILL